MKIPAFGESLFYTNKINKNSDVVTLQNVNRDSFDSYVALFLNSGYVVREENARGANVFCALQKNSCGAFINHYGNLQEMTIVTEDSSEYFAFSAPLKESILSPQITQIHLEDFGMSYVVRLSDGRFIIFDGGREFEPDARRLFDCLKEGSPHKKPIIAAWIMTHPHSDHFHCFIKFFDMFSDDVVIERFMYTFPEHDDVEHYPSVTAKNKRFVDSSIFTNVPHMKERVEKSGAKIYSPHTGQHYEIGDAKLDVLASIDDTIHRSQNVNATSLVIRMELGGQVILWGADATFSEIHLPEKYGDFLRSDILQIPHHGFQSGTAEAEIAGYKLISPKVCFLPVSDFNAYTVFCTYRAATRYLMRDAGVDEIITGDETKTITLPYVAPKEAKYTLDRKFTKGLYSAGSTAWIFADLNTSNSEDLKFSILNTTNFNATVWAELFFENTESNLRYIKIDVPRGSLKTISLDGEDVDGDAMFFNWMSLKELGIPENVPFAARFLSETPIVISNKNHTPAYVSGYNG